MSFLQLHVLLIWLVWRLLFLRIVWRFRPQTLPHYIAPIDYHHHFAAMVSLHYSVLVDLYQIELSSPFSRFHALTHTL